MMQAEKLERSSQFWIKLLGTPAMTWQGGAFSLARKQARALIYVLGETLKPVSRDQLIFLLWPDTPESSARRNLSRLLSYIRNVLPRPQLLQINKESISLDPALVWCDAAHFRQLAQQDTPTHQEAMAALYDDTFLSGFDLPNNREFDSWLTIRQVQYEGQYLLAIKDLIQIRFSGGDYGAAIDYAQRCLAIDAMAEDIHQQLIQIYAASGDRSAAMRQFETCAIILERELGVEPLPETRAIYERVQSGEIPLQSISHVKPTWTVLPSLDLPLIGREEAWAALEKTYQKFDRGGLILISGEPGVGKSRLLKEYATSKDRLVLSGNCHASTQSLPYHPLTQTLRQALSLPQLWEGIPPIWLTETGRLLPELGEHFHNLPQLIDVEPEQAQARLYEALSRVMLGLARNGSLLLCLDDLQWVDDATADWLSYLANRLPGSDLCILATYRVEEKDTIKHLREPYTRLNLLAEISLSGLSHQAIGDMLDELPNPPVYTKMLVERIANATGGNSFFVLETIRYLLENDLLVKPPAELPLAESVQSAIQRRLEKLSPVARQILEAAAVLSPDLGFNQLQQTAGRSELEAADGLDELVDHQLLTIGNQYRFNHDLIQQVTYQALNPWRRQLLHRRAAQTLVESYRSQADEVAAQIAWHYDAAGEADQAVQYYYQAALASWRIYAYEEVIDHLQRAIKLSSQISLDWREVTQYYELLSDNLKITGQYEVARQVYSDLLEQIPESEYIYRVKYETKLADIYENLNLLEKAEQGYDEALMLLNEHPDHQELAWQQAWLEIHLARLGLLYRQAKPEDMRLLLEEIKPVLDKAGTPEHRSQYYEEQVGMALRQERYAVSEHTVQIAEVYYKADLAIGGSLKIASAKFGWGFILLWSGDLEGAVGQLSEALELAEKTGRLSLQMTCLIYLTCLHRLQGDVLAARLFAARSLEIAQYLNSVPYIGAAFGNLAWLDWCERKFDQAENQARKAASVWGDYPYPFKWLAYWVLIAIYLDWNEVTQAIEYVRALLDAKQQRLPDDVTATLEKAVRNWEAGRIDSTRKAITDAVELAQERGYM